MSKQRQQARAAREAARAAEVAEAARRRDRRARRQARAGRLRGLVPRRRRRYGRLPTADLVRLLLVFLGAQLVVWLLVTDLRARLSLAVLSAAVLAVHTATRAPHRRSTTR